jgi:Ni,Fe-hydrogenase maturation factor
MEETGEGTALLEAWKGVDRIILFDARCSGAMPGTIYGFAAHNQSLQSSSLSNPCFGIPEAIELARAFHQLPTYLIVYSIEEKPSPQVWDFLWKLKRLHRKL